MSDLSEPSHGMLGVICASLYKFRCRFQASILFRLSVAVLHLSCWLLATAVLVKPEWEVDLMCPVSLGEF
jgi:hypothetical protein